MTLASNCGDCNRDSSAKTNEKNPPYRRKFIISKVYVDRPLVPIVCTTDAQALGPPQRQATLREWDRLASEGVSLVPHFHEISGF